MTTRHTDLLSNASTEWPQKAYENLTFLHSPDARPIRVLCELTEPESRFRRQKVRNTIVFFGSARTLPQDVAERNLADIEHQLAQNGSASPDLRQQQRKARQALIMSRYYEDAVVLSKKLTEWSLEIAKARDRFIICSGGGPGIMEAANRGAQNAGGRSVSLNISLPFETPNEYQADELAFEFHYFFIRKYWFFYLAKALVVFPGGCGTMDELFELLTLIQTKKTKKYMPIVLYGSEYWHEVINFEAMVKWGTISPDDLKLFHFFDDIEQAFTFLTQELIAHYLRDAAEDGETDFFDPLMPLNDQESSQKTS